MSVTPHVHFADAPPKFEETAHPRSKSGEHGGQFVKKGEEGGSSATGERMESNIPLHKTRHGQAFEVLSIKQVGKQVHMRVVTA